MRALLPPVGALSILPLAAAFSIPSESSWLVLWGVALFVAGGALRQKAPAAPLVEGTRPARTESLSYGIHISLNAAQKGATE